MSYIQDEYYILKQNLMMLKHNIRLNKIEYTIALLLFIFYTLYIMGVNDTLRMYKNDDIRMYNFNCITDTIVEVITTCNTYTLLTVHLL